MINNDSKSLNKKMTYIKKSFSFDKNIQKFIIQEYDRIKQFSEHEMLDLGYTQEFLDHLKSS